MLIDVRIAERREIAYATSSLACGTQFLQMHKMIIYTKAHIDRPRLVLVISLTSMQVEQNKSRQD